MTMSFEHGHTKSSSVRAGPLREFWAVTHWGLIVQGSIDSVQKGLPYHGVNRETFKCVVSILLRL